MKRIQIRFFGALLLGLLVALMPCTVMAKRGKKKRNVKRYHLTLHNVNTKEKLTNLWVIRTDPKNKRRQWVGKRARKRLTHFLRDWRTGRSKYVPERLLWYLYLIGQRYDKPIEVVSAYRHKERRSSRHKQGRAIDIRIKGVSPKALWNDCKRFSRVGLGYYPNSGFVHLDVRKKSYYWIDDSGPGEKARYRSHVSQPKGKKAAKAKRTAARARAGKKTKSPPAKAVKEATAKTPPPAKKAPAKTAPPAKKAPVEAEDAPSRGVKGVKSPTASPPKSAQQAKRPLIRPVRPTKGVTTPKVTAPKVAPPVISRPSEKGKKEPKAATQADKKAAVEADKEKDAVGAEDAPPKETPPKKGSAK